MRKEENKREDRGSLGFNFESRGCFGAWLKKFEFFYASN